ncbi:MAG: TonB-dependent receptor [bacterium]|nr:TonB-dependent receptor [bacterium]
MIRVCALGDSPLAKSRGTVVLWPNAVVQSLEQNGCAVFDQLPPGRYRLEVSGTDWIAQDTLIELGAGERRSLRFVMESVMTMLPEYVVESRMKSAHARSFNRCDIERSTAHDLPAFLRMEAGLDIRSDGRAGGGETVMIGGASAAQVLVRVDGRRVENIGTGEADLSSIPLDWIETVKVYRAGQTEVGSEAIGGIIDVTTRIPIARTLWSAAVEAYPTYGRAGFLGSGRVGPGISLLTFTRTEGPGDFRYRICEDDGTGIFTPDLGHVASRNNNDVTRDQLFIKWRSREQDSNAIELSAVLDRELRGMPGYLAPQTTPRARQETRQEAVNFRLFPRLGSILLSARASHDRSQREYRNADDYGRAEWTNEFSRQSEGELSATTRWRGIRWECGGLAGRERMEGNVIAGGSAARTRTALWSTAGARLLELQRHSVAVNIESGLRRETFGGDDAILPKASLGIERSGSGRFAVMVQWGKSFRAPSFYSLFWLADMATRGNPDLRAEISEEWTGQAIFESGSQNATRCEVSVSDQDVNDLIVWRRTFDNFWKPFNLQQAHVRTLDVFAEQRFLRGKLALNTGCNWTEARDDTDDRNTGGKYLTCRAPRTHRAGASLDHQGLRLSASYRWVSARPILETNSKWLSEYDLVDVQGSYTFRAGKVQLRSTIGCENLLDQDYRIVRYAPMPLRQWYAHIELSSI